MAIVLQIEIEETYNDYRLTYNRVTAALQSDNPPAAIYMANRRETREYIERVLDTAQPDDLSLIHIL